MRKTAKRAWRELRRARVSAHARPPAAVRMSLTPPARGAGMNEWAIERAHGSARAEGGLSALQAVVPLDDPLCAVRQDLRRKISTVGGTARRSGRPAVTRCRGGRRTEGLQAELSADDDIRSMTTVGWPDQGARPGRARARRSRARLARTLHHRASLAARSLESARDGQIRNKKLVDARSRALGSRALDRRGDQE